MAEPRPSCGELTDWELTDADRPYVEEFWERECLPGGYKHDPRLSLEAKGDGTPEKTEDGLVAVAPGRGIHLVVSCSAPLTSLLRRALLGNNNGVGIGQIVAGPEGDGEVVDSDLYHLAGKDQDLEGKGKTLGGVLVLCRRPLPRSESWVKKWVGLLIDRFEPQTLHFCEDVQESNLGFDLPAGEEEEDGEGEGEGGRVEVLCSQRTDFLDHRRACVVPDLAESLCSQAIPEIPVLVERSTYHPVAVCHTRSAVGRSGVLRVARAFRPLLARAGGSEVESDAEVLQRLVDGAMEGFGGRRGPGGMYA